MSKYLVGYGVSFAVFTAVDFVWLTLMGPRFYRPALEGLLADHVRMGPAVAFYLLYPAALMVLAVVPGLNAGSPLTALWHGAVLGFMAYGTYVLTNHATLSHWPVSMTIIDMAYGAAVTGIVAMVAVLITAGLAR